MPLLIRAPSIPPERRGARVEDLVRTIDIAPTALELLEVEVPASFEELRSLRRGHWKLVLAPRSELYDLASDPSEARNRIEDEADVASDLLAKLEALSRPESVRSESLDHGTRASLEALGYLGETTANLAPERPFTDLADPKDEIARYNEMNALTAVTTPTPADFERLARLLDEEPRSAKALSMYGNWMLDLHRAGEARDAFERLLEVQPESYDGHFGLGRALDETKRHYEAILARSPCYLGALVNLGVIHENEKDVKAAVRSYESAIRCDPTYAKAYRNLGATLARNGETRRALEVLREARRLLPEDEELAAAIASLEASLC